MQAPGGEGSKVNKALRALRVTPEDSRAAVSGAAYLNVVRRAEVEVFEVGEEWIGSSSVYKWRTASSL